ncbi:hypothetical protein [Hymenobacter sp. CRA2]|uniref:hypothetical protein n=1 Tax=Hymenobacter sp. CRA2 TaxID=1955620 RepID=UPI0011179E50|nr:hypothetical protein [Hymenobacter sp. CRA2]
MNISFSGKYKSLDSFEWLNVPMFAVLTGPNGVGKSQILELVYNTIINKVGTSERVAIGGVTVGKHEVAYLKGEWNLANANSIDLVAQQQQLNKYYEEFRQRRGQVQGEAKLRLGHVFSDIVRKTGKSFDLISKDEFIEHFPPVLVENENQLGQKIAEIFYNYRIDEIELKSEGLSEEDIFARIGQKPWYVLREILKEGKMPFTFNDPSKNGIRDVFTLRMFNELTGDEIKLADLSSGEKVLMSLVFYLYNSRERNTFPKLLLL